MVFHWSLSDSKSPQVSRTPPRILAVLSSAVIWIVSTRPTTSKSPRPLNNPLPIVPKAPITIGTIVTFMFHSFFNSLARLRYLPFFLHSFRFILWSAGTAKSTILKNIIVIIIYSLRVFHIRLVFHGSLSNSKFLQVSRTLINILAALNNVAVWMVSTHPLIPSPPVPLTILCDCTKTTNHDWYNCHFHFPWGFQFSSKVPIIILLFPFFSFILWSAGTAKSTILQVLFFFFWLL